MKSQIILDLVQKTLTFMSDPEDNHPVTVVLQERSDIPEKSNFEADFGVQVQKKIQNFSGSAIITLQANS